MRTRRTRWTAAAIGLVALIVLGPVACGEAKEAAEDAADELAEQGVAAWAQGRWRCEGEIGDGELRPVTTLVAIGSEGRFSYEIVGEEAPLVGTWAIEGLELRLSVPWDDDGSNGFIEWVHDADGDRPTHLAGRQVEGDAVQDLDLDIDVAARRVHLVQADDGVDGGTNYDWDVTCTRESSDPGTIPPTVPPSTRGG